MPRPRGCFPETQEYSRARPVHRADPSRPLAQSASLGWRVPGTEALAVQGRLQALGPGQGPLSLVARRLSRAPPLEGTRTALGGLGAKRRTGHSHGPRGPHAVPWGLEQHRGRARWMAENHHLSHRGDSGHADEVRVGQCVPGTLTETHVFRNGEAAGVRVGGRQTPAGESGRLRGQSEAQGSGARSSGAVGQGQGCDVCIPRSSVRSDIISQ